MQRIHDQTKIILIVGPTGAGKTGLAIDLAQRFNAEIVGADAMQVYRYMDIGTAKPTAEEQAAAPHHMIDIIDPDEDFDAAAYAKMADDNIREIIARGRMAFVVGGTGFYIKALIHGLFAEGPSDPSLRRRLKQQAQSQGSAALHRRLQHVDAQAARRIHPNDSYRIIRALEVFEATGQPLSVYQRRHGFRERRYDTLEIGLAWPRPVLYERINRRVDKMMAMGFNEEVRHLLARGYAPTLKSMQSLGYRHLAAAIAGDVSMDEAVRTLKRDHRRYAKRQLTWFGARESVHWLTPDETETADDLIGKFLT